MRWVAEICLGVAGFQASSVETANKEKLSRCCKYC